MSILIELLTEGAERAFKRKDHQITRYYRCTSGPKKGKLASEPSKCGVRPDPKKVRHGRKVARQKGSIRIRKTLQTKKQHVSKRITQLNKALRDRYDHNNLTTRNEMFDIVNTINCMLLLKEYTEDTFYIVEQAMKHSDQLVSNNTLTIERLKDILTDSGYTDLEDMLYIDDIIVKSPGKLLCRVAYNGSGEEVIEFANIYLSVDDTGKWKASF